MGYHLGVAVRVYRVQYRFMKLMGLRMYGVKGGRVSAGCVWASGLRVSVSGLSGFRV